MSPMQPRRARSRTRTPASSHVADAREPGGRDAQPGDPAAEEYGLGPVRGEERLACTQDVPTALLEYARPLQQASPTGAADEVADVVADDGAERGQRDDELDL
jgi:hypothetical protein